MKKLIIFVMSIFSLINPLMAQSSDTIPDIRKICFDFMLSKGEVSKDSERYLYLTQVKERNKQNDLEVIASVLWINDLTNKKVIEGEESIPIQEDLIQYSVRSLNPHGLSYLMIVKNGIYEIIDTGESLNNILDQIIRYSRNNAMASDELLDVLESALRLYKSNSSVYRGAPLC